MKALYYVTLSFDAVIVAENEADAMRTARHRSGDILRDSGVTPVRAVRIDSTMDLHALDTDWNADCYPYGGDGEKTIGQMLPPAEIPSQRATKHGGQGHD